MTYSERGRRAILARLAVSDWTEHARAAFESPNHPAAMERWRKTARARNPHLDDRQVERLAEMLRSEHFAELGRRSGEAKRARKAAGYAAGVPETVCMRCNKAGHQSRDCAEAAA